MKIDKLNTSPAVPASTHQPAAKTTKSVQVKPSLEPQVSIDSKWVDDAQKSLAELPNIDMQKVTDIKAALSKGDINLDIAELSRAVMRFHTGHE